MYFKITVIAMLSLIVLKLYPEIDGSVVYASYLAAICLLIFWLYKIISMSIKWMLHKIKHREKLSLQDRDELDEISKTLKHIDWVSKNAKIK